MKSCAVDKFKGTLDITLFTTENPKIFKTENNHIFVLIAASFKDRSGGNVTIEQKENMAAKEQV